MSTAASMRRGSEPAPTRQLERALPITLLLAVTALGLAACSHTSFHRELPASKVQQASARPPWRTPDKPTTLSPTQLRAQLQTLVDAMLKAERPAEQAAEHDSTDSDSTSPALNAYLRFYLPSMRSQVIEDLHAVLGRFQTVSALPHNRKITLIGSPSAESNGCVISNAILAETPSSSRTPTTQKALVSFASSPAVTHQKSTNTFGESSDTRLFIIALFRRVRLTTVIAKEICTG